MKYKLSNATKLLVLGAVLAAGIFISDIFTPLGIADGVSYIAVILLTLWIKELRYTYIAAAVATVLTIAGLTFSGAGEPPSVFLTNRALSLLGIWTAAFAIIKYKKSEQVATENKESLDALFANATEGILIIDNQGALRMANPKSEEQFGYSSGELKDKKIDALLTGFNISEIALTASCTGKNSSQIVKEFELRARKKNEDTFTAEVRLSSYTRNGEVYFIAFILDITERKKQQAAIQRSNEELKQQARQLKEINSELENFAYISSHDLQEPLRKIQSFGDRLKLKESANLSENGIDYINRMLNASGRMQRLIDDLLSFSRLTSKARGFEPVNLNEIVRDVLSDMEVTIERNQAEVLLLTPLPVIDADHTQMRQLFQNIIGNAIKFKKENEAPKIKIFCIQEQGPSSNVDNITIIIEDNGIGFNEKYLDKIFNIFQRLDGKKYEGSGIGLAICKKIALRHNGSITAQSQPGFGSRFIISLPLKQTAGQKKQTEKEIKRETKYAA